MSELLIVMLALIVSLPRVVRAAMPYLPATIWALRVPRDSPHYRCPQIDNHWSTVPSIADRGED